MKKIICAALALIILGAAALLPVSAAAPKYSRLLLLGDSITYGYGLEGDVNSCASYGNLVKADLGLDAAHFKNAAVNGYTSEQLLALLPSVQSYVKSSDLIIITIGGNDLLHIVWDALDKVFEGGFRDYSQLPDVLSDPAKMQKLIEQLTLAQITSAIVKYTTNLAAITSYIRTNNADAEVIFLAQYDPMEGVEGIEALSSVAAAAISMLNAAMKSQVTLGGCTYLDVYTPFKGHATEWTNILSIDIHPNKEGHAQIYRLVMNYLEQKAADDTTAEDTTAAVTTAPETTTAPVTTEAVTTAPVTTVPDTTTPDTAATDTTTATVPAAVTDPTDGKSGCGSLAAPVLLAAVIPAAVIVCKKKKLQNN